MDQLMVWRCLDTVSAGEGLSVWSFSSSNIIYENGDERGAPLFSERSFASGDFFRWRISSIEMVLAMIQTAGLPDAPLTPISVACSGDSPCSLASMREKAL